MLVGKNNNVGNVGAMPGHLWRDWEKDCKILVIVNTKKTDYFQGRTRKCRFCDAKQTQYFKDNKWNNSMYLVYEDSACLKKF